MKPLPRHSVARESTLQTSEPPRQMLSAAMDGDEQALDAACGLWRDDENARRDWHTWHLIGDVLRSDELASAPARDADFLVGLRTRLAAEPVVLAPQPLPVKARRRQPWLVPAAAAAGFALVAGVLLAARLGAPGAPAGAVLAGAAPSAPGAQLVSARVQGYPAVPRSDVYIRDARIDEFLRAHQHARGGVAMAAQREGLRNIEVTGPVAAPVSR